MFTTAISVILGTVVSTLIPIVWVKLAGGTVMIAYGLREAKGLIGQRAIEEEERKLESTKGALRAFLGMFIALAILDLAGDATMILTIILAAQYSDRVLVFTATCVGLIGATAFETALGNRLGRMLTPNRLRYIAVVVFVALGSLIIITSL
ncbi:MAG: TMEM165/GDT1 family protein [Thaumarchaeota archaeon]|nr:TMEM165/GDT1 family protein [Nitrososphaerota archaeon]